MLDDKEPTSMLTELQSCIDGVFKSLRYHGETSDIHKWELVRVLFEQSMMHDRTRMIAQQKKDTTAQIQGYKKTNIANMNKGV